MGLRDLLRLLRSPRPSGVENEAGIIEDPSEGHLSVRDTTESKGTPTVSS